MDAEYRAACAAGAVAGENAVGDIHGSGVRIDRAALLAGSVRDRVGGEGAVGDRQRAAYVEDRAAAHRFVAVKQSVADRQCAFVERATATIWKGGIATVGI